jgi:hypothetical protein
LSYIFQSCGWTPRIARSEPGQNMVAVRIPAFSAVTHNGSDSSHQKGSWEMSALPMEKVTPGFFGSSMVLSTMPLRSGRSPVTRV